MIDAKILNWALIGGVEINSIYRAVEPDLLRNVLLPTFKDSFDVITDYYGRHKVPPSLDVIRSILNKNGSDSSIVDLIESERCKESEIGFCLDEIKERYNKYILNSFAKKIIGDEEVDVVDFNDDLRKILSKTDKLYRNDVFSEGEVRLSVKDRLNDYRFTEENPEQVMGLLSGFKDVDEYTWGVKNSEMLVIGGASSSGKSLLMMCMAINAWMGSNSPTQRKPIKNDGKNILYVSLEMSKKQLEQRIDANLAGVRHRGLLRASLDDKEKLKWKESLKFQSEYEKTFYILDMPRGSTMAEIEAKYESILGIFKPDAIFIDYLQLMSPSTGAVGTDWIDVGRVSEELHEFCRKKDLPVITAAQRKAVQKKNNGKSNENVSLEDLGRSKMIGDNATIVMLIGNRQDEQLREDMEIHIVKNRDGARGKVFLRKAFDKSKIENLPDGWAEDFGDENEL